MSDPDGAPYAVQVPENYRVGRWAVTGPLASGAFATVYAARKSDPDPADPTTEDEAEVDDLPDRVALKFLPTGTSTPRQLRHLQELAQRELEVYRLLSRPRLIRMYEAITVDDPGQPALDGATVLVLERATGSLADLLDQVAPEPLPGGPEVLAQVCEGLVQLHSAGWVHGDLKPANVLMLPDSSARLADFNLAAEMEGTHAYTPAFSTPDYTPPELLWSQVGERGQLIRPTADVWAFGVLAHLVLTGTMPLPGGTGSTRRDAALRYARGTEELRLSPRLPEAWRSIVGDCLARTHEERAAHTGNALLRRVEAAAGAERSPRLPRLRPRRAGPPRRALVAAGAAAAALVAAVGLIDLWGGDHGATGELPRVVDPASFASKELATHAGIPVAYRRVIVRAAHNCEEAPVDPPLIAALLKVESDFDPELSDPRMNEYGIARWTPSVLYYWLSDRERPEDVEHLKPPFPPSMSIAAVGRYLCNISPRLWSNLPGDHQVLIAAAYRTSHQTVNKAGGVPAEYRRYADRIAHYLPVYAPTRR